MQGFLSRDGMPPAELLAAGRDEVAGYGGHLVSGTVTDGRRPATQRRLPRSPSRTATRSPRGAVLVTTGLRDELPDIPGVRERWGRDLLHCPYCHGYEVRDQPLGVLGGTPDAVQHALLVRQWSDDVVFFAHTGTLTDDEREQLVARAIGVVDGPVSRLVVEDDRLQGVELEDGRVVAATRSSSAPASSRTATCSPPSAARPHENGWVVADPPAARASRASGWPATP